MPSSRPRLTSLREGGIRCFAYTSIAELQRANGSLGDDRISPEAFDEAVDAIDRASAIVVASDLGAAVRLARKTHNRTTGSGRASAARGSLRENAISISTASAKAVASHGMKHHFDYARESDAHQSRLCALCRARYGSFVRGAVRLSRNFVHQGESRSRRRC